MEVLVIQWEHHYWETVGRSMGLERGSILKGLPSYCGETSPEVGVKPLELLLYGRQKAGILDGLETFKGRSPMKEKGVKTRSGIR